MGDEARHSQHGNNNAYCQDNETGWFDWTMVTKHAELHRFVKLLIARRLLRDVEHERERVSLNQLIRGASKAWHGVNRTGVTTRTAWRLLRRFEGKDSFFHLIVNAYWERLDFELPMLSGGSDIPWRRWIDTYLDTPHDIVEWQAAPSISGSAYRTGPRSCGRVFREYCVSKLIKPKGRADRFRKHRERRSSAKARPSALNFSDR